MTKARASHLVLGLLIAAFAGCTSVDVVPGSERVRVFESEPKGCLYIGEVSSIQKKRELSTLATEMSLDTRIDLRNKAYKLGANVLVFMKPKSAVGTTSATATAPKATEPVKVVEVESDSSSDEASSSSEGPLVFLATAFKCPSGILNQ
ncbi:DUF4156 domain-containing protein [Pseudobdellovibrio exovorus]|uniref:Lipoprotein n=1 Tax=Pseudobdellovibrio exovorus JSS TaxID=1184267 RepID=M4VB66_9BACT|nr:DUF4156 domain-containing protein [Pseudobdellovibrio exovorus]AGH95720.1 hypothetical protein A11Q_1504 [Pseudobdellovibrio exovorus JSS]